MLWMDGETEYLSGDNPLPAGLPAPGPVEPVDNPVRTQKPGDRPRWASVHNPQALLLRLPEISDLLGTATLLPRRPR
jgi:hypothetical protein